MKKMEFQLVHSIYGKTEQSVICRAAEYGARAPESRLSGSAAASQLRVSLHRSSSN